MMTFRTKVALAMAVVVGVGGLSLAFVKRDAFALTSTNGSAPSVFALVNRQQITSADVEGLMAAGMVKAVAVDNAINRVLAAEAARRTWPSDAEAVSEAVTREALAGLFLRKKYAELHKAVSDEEIARFYETNVKDELYSGHVLKYYLTQDNKDAAEVAEAIKQASGAALNKFAWVNKDGDHAVLPAGVPYGLYQQVKALQSGQYLGPWRVRDGFLFLKLEERKQVKRPELAKVKEEVRQLIAQQRLEASLKDMREHAKIELK